MTVDINDKLKEATLECVLEMYKDDVIDNIRLDQEYGESSDHIDMKRFIQIIRCNQRFYEGVIIDLKNEGLI